jgi:hypothetical protein
VGVVVDVQRIEGDEQATTLLDGRIDVGHVRLPIDEAGVRRQAQATRGSGAGRAGGRRAHGVGKCARI